MKIFLSWSKPASRHLALALRDWLPEVIQEVDPWMSSEDIDKGQRWRTEIGARLDEIDQGILCITGENVAEPWLNFEAGALGKYLDEAVVRPVLLGLKPSDVTGPLAQFQATVGSDRDDMAKLVQSLNRRCSHPLEETRLDRAFGRSWDDFSARIAAIKLRSGTNGPESRHPEEIIPEILDGVRAIQRTLDKTGLPDLAAIGAQEAGFRPVWETAGSGLRLPEEDAPGRVRDPEKERDSAKDADGKVLVEGDRISADTTAGVRFGQVTKIVLDKLRNPQHATLTVAFDGGGRGVFKAYACRKLPPSPVASADDG